MKCGIVCLILVLAGFVGAARAQNALTANQNEQFTQYFRALLTSGGTQAVVQAVTDAVRLALQQGPLPADEAARVMASSAPTAAVAATPTVAPKSWTDAITLKGDLRYRFETVQDESKLDASDKTYTRERERIRARLGVEAKINDDVKAVVRLSTGQTDPIYGNDTLDNAGAKKEMRLDLAYIDWNLFGESTKELHLLAGKMVNPFITLPDDLIWDPDLTPEGLALKGMAEWGPLTLYGNAGYIWIKERNAQDPLMLHAGQLAARYEFIPEIALTIGAGYFGFHDLKYADVIDWEAKNNAYGNSTVDGTGANQAWASDFYLVHAFAQLDTWIMGVPFSLYAQGLDNLAADSLGRGYMFGASVGKAKNPGTFEIGASYAKLEKDATPGMWTDSDRWGGGTDGSGYKGYAKYQVMKNLQAGLTYFVDDKVISDAAKTRDYQRVQVDLVASF